MGVVECAACATPILLREAAAGKAIACATAFFNRVLRLIILFIILCFIVSPDAAHSMQ